LNTSRRWERDGKELKRKYFGVKEEIEYLYKTENDARRR
jgi:hypothetical protein